MLPNPHLDAIIARETFAEMLAQLTPKQLAVVALRLDGIGFDAAGEILGLSRCCVYGRLITPRRKLPERFPHIKTLLEGDS